MANAEPHPMPLLYYRRQYLRIQRAEASPLEGVPGTLGAVAAMPTVRANDLDIAYEVHGAGPPLVMLHGATSIGREDFAAQIPLLSKAFQLYLPDARGHGLTAWDAADGFRYDWLVEDLAAFVDALGLETFHLLGFSMGAMTALQYAARFDDRLRTLVVVGITTQREPRASVARRLMDPRRADVDDPAWGVVLARRHDAGPGRRGLAAAPAGDRRGRRVAAAAHAARPPRDRARRRWSSAATATRSCRSIMPGASSGSCPTAGCSSCRTAATR